MRAAILAWWIVPSFLLAQEKPAMKDLFESAVHQGSKGKLPYRLLRPATVEEKKTYPLVVFLHGAGERGDDNRAQLTHGAVDFTKKEIREKYPCYLLVPQCPKMRRWAEVDWSSSSHDMPKDASEPATLLLALMDRLCADLPIDRSRIYLTGLSMGGYGTWDLLCRHPERFAAGLPICGGGDEKHAGLLVNIPIWAFHGDKDFAVKVDRSRNMIEAIRKAGGRPIYTEYAGVGHDSWTQTYANRLVMDWLFAQKKSKPAEGAGR